MRKITIIFGLILLGIGLALAIPLRADPFDGLSKFGAVMTSQEAPYLRVYSFPAVPIQLYEYLESEGGSDMNRLEFKRGWNGSFDPMKRELTVVRHESTEGLWTRIKIWLGLESQGCG